MSDFKVGDKVERTGGTDCEYMVMCCEYVVSRVTSTGWLMFPHSNRSFNPRYFTLVEDTSNYYKHYDIVIAWVQVKVIQFKDNRGDWATFETCNNSKSVPSFYTDYEYRIKPEPCPKEDKLECLVSKLEEQLKEAQGQLKELRNE